MITIESDLIHDRQRSDITVKTKILILFLSYLLDSTGYVFIVVNMSHFEGKKLSIYAALVAFYRETVIGKSKRFGDIRSRGVTFEKLSKMKYLIYIF